MKRRDIAIATLIILLGAYLRLRLVTYGLSDVCLTPSAETWLFDETQSTSLYRWNIAPPEAFENIPGRIPMDAAALVDASTRAGDRLLLRLASLACGLLVTALTLHIGRRLRADWWGWAGLLVAVAPWQIAADRWTVRFDLAALMVALSIALLIHAHRRRSASPAWHHGAAISLLWIGAPLWWLTGVLLWVHPRPNWRWIVFSVIALVVLIPGMQSPQTWLLATQQWDVGALAAVALALILLALWVRRRIGRLRWLLVPIAVVMSAFTLAADRQWITPDDAEWTLIRWLQTRIPDDAVIQLDGELYALSWIVTCPAGAKVDYQLQAQPVPFFEARALETPYYQVSLDAEAVAQMPYTTKIAERYYVGRSLELPHPIDIAFGDLIYVLSTDIRTPTVPQAGTLDIRIDYQFGANITPDSLAYAAFIHLTEPNAPDKKWAEYTDPFVEESGNTGSRRVMLNHHARMALPPDIPPGSYDVLYGIYNVYTGERLPSSEGDILKLGTIQVE